MEAKEVAKQRKPVSNEAVAKRTHRRLADLPKRARDANIQPLNPGFFQLEAMRAASGAKRKAQVRAKHRG